MQPRLIGRFSGLFIWKIGLSGGQEIEFHEIEIIILLKWSGNSHEIRSLDHSPTVPNRLAVYFYVVFKRRFYLAFFSSISLSKRNFSFFCFNSLSSCQKIGEKKNVSFIFQTKLFSQSVSEWKVKLWQVKLQEIFLFWKK